MKNIKAILFDVDNTLVFGEKAGFFYRKYSEVLEEVLACELGIPAERGRLIADDYRLRFNGQGEKAFEMMNIGMEKWYDAILSLDPGDYLEPMDGSAEILSALKKRGFIIGAITDGPTPQAKRILSSAKIDENIFDVFIGWERGKMMPKGGSTEIFEKIIAELGISSNEAVMVGDSLRVDVLPAIASGLKAIHIGQAEDEKQENEWITIDSIKDLIKILNI